MATWGRVPARWGDPSARWDPPSLPELNEEPFPSGRDTIGIRTSSWATGRLQSEAGAMPQVEGRHATKALQMHEEAVLNADNDLSFREKLVEEALGGWISQDMLNKGPAKWGDIRPTKEEVLKVLMLGVEGALEHRLSLVHGRWNSKAKREGIRRRIAMVQAKVDDRAAMRWGYKKGAGAGKRMKDAMAIGEEGRDAAVKRIMRDAKVRGEEGHDGAVKRTREALDMDSGKPWVAEGKVMVWGVALLDGAGS
jgi:hypothetical protein